MTNPASLGGDVGRLLARLQRLDFYENSHGLTSSRLRNPDGPEAAKRIEADAATIATLQAKLERVTEALQQVGGKARLGGDCLGNSPPEFASCQRSFYLLADLCDAALSNKESGNG